MYRVGLLLISIFLLGGGAPSLASEAMLVKETGEKVLMQDLKFFKNRPKFRGYVDTAVRRGCADNMAIAITPPFSPSYAQASWCGSDTRQRALAKCNSWLRKKLAAQNWPFTSGNGFQCSVVIRNMQILNTRALEEAQRYVRVSLHILEKNKEIEILDGLLAYEVPKLRKQEFTLFNADRTAVCEGNVEVAMGKYGEITGTCFGNAPIRSGKFTINCGYGGGCERHMVGNMTVSNALVGIVSKLSKKETRALYPGFPRKFSLIDGSEPEENFD